MRLTIAGNDSPLYGLWDCSEWSSDLQSESQVGSNPTWSTIWGYGIIGNMVPLQGAVSGSSPDISTDRVKYFRRSGAN